MSADVPLLNDYKKTFVRNRLCQTLLGGIRVFGVPWYTVILQIGECFVCKSALVKYQSQSAVIEVMDHNFEKSVKFFEILNFLTVKF